MRYTNYGFAAGDALLPVYGPELARMAMELPLAFVRVKGQFVPAAVMGVEPGRNLYVGSSGQWLGQYVPAIVRSHPFALLRADDGRHVLCVNEASGLIVPGTESSGSEPFYNADGRLSSETQAVLDFLAAVEGYKPTTVRACSALEASGVLQPWELTLELVSGKRSIGGVYSVSEQLLSTVADNIFLGLRDAGALALAYTQLMSMQNVKQLEVAARLDEERRLAAQAVTPGGVLDLSFLQGDTLRF